MPARRLAPAVTRRSFLRRAAAGIGALAAGKAFGKSELEGHKGFRERVSRTAARHEKHYSAARELALQMVAPGEPTRLQHAKQAFSASRVLPDYLKKTLPYVPFVESAFRTSAKSSAGAVGMWQFMSSTGRRYGLVGKKFDHRRDPKKATKAAVRYFEDIYRKLSKDPNYRAIKKRYGLKDDRFLHLAVINAFNSGEHHMQRAMEVMNKENSVRKEVDEHAKHGGEGLFHYMTTKYAGDWKRWQKPVMKGPYYIRQSPAYSYKVLAYKRLHEGGKVEEAGPEKEKEPEKDEIKVATASAPKMEKVEGRGIKRYEDEAWSVRQHAKTRFNDFPGNRDAFASDNYMFNQRMGDAAYELYKSAPENNERFLVLSRYYYDKARGLARGQIEERPGYILPKGGKKAVNRRLKYCDAALDIVESEF